MRQETFYPKGGETLRTIAVTGTDEVMAPLGTLGTFYRGRHVRVLIKSLLPDEDLPLEVRSALIGLEVDTIFSSSQILEQCGPKVAGLIPQNSRLAYSGTIVKALHDAGKDEEAGKLLSITPDSLDMIYFQDDYLELL